MLKLLEECLRLPVEKMVGFLYNIELEAQQIWSKYVNYRRES